MADGPLALAHEATGSGPPVVIVHGLFGSGRNWAGIARQLSAQARLLTVDLRNHGASPHSDVMTYQAMAADLDRFIAAHTDGRAPVIGHSMGGKAAMTLALCEPDRVERLIVVDVAPVDYGVDAGPQGFGAYIKAMQAVPLNAIERRADADPHLAKTIKDAGIRAFLLQNLVRGEEGAWHWRLNLPVLARSLSEIGGFPDPGARQYLGKTGFLRGGRSGYVTEAHRPTIRRYFPQAQHGQVAEAGHWVHAEAPDTVARIIADFLN